MTPDELRQRLQDLGWSQAALARRVGVHPNTSSKWATGQTAVPVAVAELLNVLAILKEMTK